MPFLRLGNQGTGAFAHGVDIIGIVRGADGVWTFNPDSRQDTETTQDFPSGSFSFANGFRENSGGRDVNSQNLTGEWDTNSLTLKLRVVYTTAALAQVGLTVTDGRPARFGTGDGDPFYFIIDNVDGGGYRSDVVYFAAQAFAEYESLPGGLHAFTFTFVRPYAVAGERRNWVADTVEPGYGRLHFLTAAEILQDERRASAFVQSELRTRQAGVGGSTIWARCQAFVIPYAVAPREIEPEQPAPTPSPPGIPTQAPPTIALPDQWNVSARLGVSHLPRINDPANFLSLDLTPWVSSVQITEGEGDLSSRTGRLTLAGRYADRGRRPYEPATPARVVDDFIARYANDSIALTVTVSRGEGQDAESYSWGGLIQRLEYDEGRGLTRIEWRNSETETSFINRVRALITTTGVRALSDFHLAQDNLMTDGVTVSAMNPDLAQAILNELDSDDDTPSRLLRTLHRYAIDVAIDSTSTPSLVDYAGRLIDGEGDEISVTLAKNDLRSLVRVIDFDNRPGVPNRVAPDNVWQYEKRPLRLTRQTESGTSAEPEVITVPSSGALGKPVDLGAFDNFRVARARINCARRVLSAEVTTGKAVAVRFRPDIRPHVGIQWGSDITDWPGTLNWRAGSVKHVFTPTEQSTEIEAIGGRF